MKTIEHNIRNEKCNTVKFRKSVSMLLSLIIMQLVNADSLDIWTPIDAQTKKHYGLSACSLLYQPVMVVEFIPKMDSIKSSGVSLAWLREHGFPELPGDGCDEDAESHRYCVINVPTKPMTDCMIKNWNIGTRSGAAYGTGVTYAACGFGLINRPKNTMGVSPFCYVVDAGKVVYSGTSANEAISALKSAIAARGVADSMLGYFKPTILLDLATQLKFGEDISKTLARLNKIVKNSKDSPLKQEACLIVSMISQSKIYWLDMLSKYSSSNDPFEAYLISEKLSTTFPEERSYCKNISQTLILSRGAIISKLARAYVALDAYKRKPLTRKSDIAKVKSLLNTTEIQLAKLDQSIKTEKLKALLIKVKDSINDAK